MFGNNLRGSTGFLFSLRVRCTARGRGHLHRLRKEEAQKIEMLDYKLIRPPPESSKVFSMAKFMSSWILFDVAVVEDLWVALTLFVSLWKLNLPACWKFEYGDGKTLFLSLLISTSSLPDFFFFKVFFLDEGLLANCASFTCLAFRLESRFPIKNKELMSSWVLPELNIQPPVVPSGAGEYDDERDARPKENPSGDVETAIVDPVRLVVKSLKWTRIHLGE